MEESFQLDWKISNPVQRVRESCQELIATTSHVKVDDAGVKAFAEELSQTPLLKLPKKSYPLQFPTANSEINFLATLALLQIGSGWRVPLHAQRNGTGKGAAETMTFGCMGLHISGEITAATMSNIGLFEVAQIFDIKIMEEYEISRGIRSERKTELYSLAEAIRRVLNDSGNTLRSLQCNDFADFFLKAAKVQEVDPATNQPVRPKAEAVVARLVRSFQWLQDAYVLQEPPQEAKSADAASSSSSSAAPAASAAAATARVVYLLKKAQLIVGELYLRFHDDAALAHVFNYSDVDQLTVFSDNVLPAVLRAKGVLKYSEALATKVDEGTKIANREMEACIRAGAVVASEEIIRVFNENLKNKPAAVATSTEASTSSSSAATDSSSSDDVPTSLNPVALDYHLWLLGKKPELRQIRRHATYSLFY